MALASVRLPLALRAALLGQRAQIRLMQGQHAEARTDVLAVLAQVGLSVKRGRAVPRGGGGRLQFGSGLLPRSMRGEGLTLEV